MINNFIQNVYYHYILSEPSLVFRIMPEYFSTKVLQNAFKVARDYVVKYHEAPSLKQMKELVRSANMQEELEDDILDTLYGQAREVDTYGRDWLYDAVTNWASLENIKKSITDAAAYLKLNQDSMEDGNAKDVVEHIKTMFNKSCQIEFNDENDGGSDFWDAESHREKKLVRSSTGYDFLDMCLNGGYFGGALICFVGAPKVGKSLWMQNLCATSVKRGENNAYISLELPEELVVARIGSNMFSIPSLEYSTYASDTEAFRQRIFKFRKSCIVPPGTLIVKDFPTSTLSVIELESYLLAKEEELSTEDKPFKFKNIFVDYLNIMRNYRNPNSENTYMKIKQLAEDLRAMGAKNNWCIITGTQTNRAQFDANDIQTNQVSESSALGATVDAMFGIICDPALRALNKYYLKCMYDRVAPHANKKKGFDCNFDFMRISEDDTPVIDTTLESVTEQTTRNLAKIAKHRAADFAPGVPNKPASTPTLFEPSSQTGQSGPVSLLQKPNFDLFNKEKN